jgi:hypothetical protein
MSKRINLNNLIVASACPANWHHMVGDDRARFCNQCNLNVYNIANLTETEAIELIAQNEERLCGRLYRRADGTVITKDCPIGIKVIRRKVTKIAGATLAALLSLVTPATALSQSPAQQDQKQTSSDINASAQTMVEGTVTDSTGAAIVGATVVLTSVETKKEYKASTNESGVYKLVLPADQYTLKVLASGFTTAETKGFNFQANKRSSIAIELQPAADTEIVGILLCPESNTSGGAAGVNRGNRDNNLPKFQPYSKMQKE